MQRDERRRSQAEWKMGLEIGSSVAKQRSEVKGQIWTILQPNRLTTCAFFAPCIGRSIGGERLKVGQCKDIIIV